MAPERLRDYIERFLAIIHSYGTTAGIYAHASVGCLHVRPVINMKTEEGVRKFEAIAHDVADLVLEFGGALSAEHGDGLVRSPFMRQMFGPALYEAFREIKANLRPAVGSSIPERSWMRRRSLPTSASERAIKTSNPPTWFDFDEYGGMGGAVEMCSGVGACRKKLAGTMCPSYMATLEEAHSTRGRANVLRLAMSGRTGGCRTRRRRRARGARPLPGMPRLQIRMPGRRGCGTPQERISRRLLGAARHAAAGSSARPDRPRIAMGRPVRAARELVQRGCARPMVQSALPGHRSPARASRMETADLRAMEPRQARPAAIERASRDPVQRHLYQPLRSEISAAALQILSKGGYAATVVRPVVAAGR